MTFVNPNMCWHFVIKLGGFGIWPKISCSSAMQRGARGETSPGGTWIEINHLSQYTETQLVH